MVLPSAGAKALLLCTNLKDCLADYRLPPSLYAVIICSLLKTHCFITITVKIQSVAFIQHNTLITLAPNFLDITANKLGIALRPQKTQLTSEFSPLQLGQYN